jgi:Flp pilus assembly protein TadB
MSGSVSGAMSRSMSGFMAGKILEKKAAPRAFKAVESENAVTLEIELENAAPQSAKRPGISIPAFALCVLSVAAGLYLTLNNHPLSHFLVSAGFFFLSMGLMLPSLLRMEKYDREYAASRAYGPPPSGKDGRGNPSDSR